MLKNRKHLIITDQHMNYQFYKDKLSERTIKFWIN